MLIELATRFVAAVERLADAQSRIADTSALAARLSEQVGRAYTTNYEGAAGSGPLTDIGEPEPPSAPTPTPVAAPPDEEPKAKRARKPKPTPEPAPVAPADAPTPSREEIQADVIRLSSLGYRARIIQIMGELGFERLSKCPDDKLAALAKALAGLENPGAELEVF